MGLDSYMGIVQSRHHLDGIYMAHKKSPIRGIWTVVVPVPTTPMWRCHFETKRNLYWLSSKFIDQHSNMPVLFEETTRNGWISRFLRKGSGFGQRMMLCREISKAAYDMPSTCIFWCQIDGCDNLLTRWLWPQNDGCPTVDRFHNSTFF